MTLRNSTAEAIVGALRANGVDTVFGLPGAQMYPLFQALGATPEMRVLGARHEQATAYMAFGYARSAGRPGVYSVVPGPGVLNTTAALATALGTNTPVLCLTGEVPSAFLGQGRGHLHELPDQLATLRLLTKWAGRINGPAEAAEVMDTAFREMLSGRQGPVAVEVPWDVLGQVAEVPEARPTQPAPPPPIDREATGAAAALLATARRPMIMTGGGALDASEAVRALAEALQAPATAFRSGRGVVSEAHPLGINCAAAYQLWPETDVLVAIGTRVELQMMRWTGMMALERRLKPPRKLIRIDIDPAEMFRVHADVSIVGDAAEATRALVAALPEEPRADATDRIATARAAARGQMDDIQPQMNYLDAIRSVLPEDGFFVEELSQAGFASYFGFPVYQPRTYVTPGYQGTLGFGFQTALGVKVAWPDRAVVSISGDGGFMFGVQELATAVQYGVAVVAIVFNNQGYENVRRDQVTRFGGQAVAAELVNPDFVALAESFGARGVRAGSPEALVPVLHQALAGDGPTLIEVPVAPGSEVSAWPLILPVPI